MGSSRGAWPLQQQVMPQQSQSLSPKHPLPHAPHLERMVASVGDERLVPCARRWRVHRRNMRLCPAQQRLVPPEAKVVLLGCFYV